ncbi:hypothetical protein DFA_00669 [Cavenderia fasciculata]|uniref:Uncharacterized protein n=1 Tax=Cavenderia fasciculata TaxID=261658 RepID=F4PT68_CACFS|nr:uncharacterized protein DFA_00669 [Cavenderia fasciculata]EGG20804.1 hypothetical protein DFA_00669 [Cavenderia fasciculata]|eukprot:XP_004358654.1 hypothetical protein DFA_00669 [Cavenderia fasciculata]
MLNFNVRRISIDGLPKLEPKYNSPLLWNQPTPTNINSKLVVRDFTNINYPPDQDTLSTSTIWISSENESLVWYNFACIYYHFRHILIELIDNVGLRQHLWCTNDSSITGLQPDVWVIVTMSGLPIGVVGIKEPKNNNMANEEVHDQIFNYMERLRSYTGQKNVFGIVTCYEQWRVYWLPDSDHSASSPYTPSQFSPHQLVDQDTVPVRSSSPKGSSNIQVQEIPNTPGMVYGTNLIRYDSSSLVPILCSTILKMYYSPREPVLLISPTRSYIRVTKESWNWVKLKDMTLSYEGVCPNESLSSAILIKDLRSRMVQSRCRLWMASTENGSVFVIKYVRQDKDIPDPKKVLAKEANIWKIAYNITTPVRKMQFCMQNSTFFKRQYN